jgi:hypothetical protein
MHARTRVSITAAFALAWLASARPAEPAEISAFVSGAGPSETWSRGYGGMLTISLFSIVHGELEGGWQGSDLPNTSIVIGHAKAYLGPKIGSLVPYAGLGAGVYHESFAGGSDSGTLGSVFAGVKVKFPMGIVLRGEYQWLNLPQPAPLKLDNRYFFALGLSI